MVQGEEIAVAKTGMNVVPQGEWNRWSARPSDRSELWTRDGIALNELTFFARIANGEPIYRERDKRNQPMPKFRSDMLATDLVDLFEQSNRIILQTSVFEVLEVEPAKLGGEKAVRFRYRYAVKGDELDRSGEAVAANIKGKLYIVNFSAPSIYYFDRDLPEFRAMADSITL